MLSNFSLHSVNCWAGCQKRNGKYSKRDSLDLIEARNKSGNYTVLRPALHVYRRTELPQYTLIGITVVLIRELTLGLSKNNFEK